MAPPPSVVFHGDAVEAHALIDALAHNCGCQYAQSGARLATCAAHQMFVEDQRALDGLVFIRRDRARLLREEGCDP